VLCDESLIVNGSDRDHPQREPSSRSREVAPRGGATGHSRIGRNMAVDHKTHGGSACPSRLRIGHRVETAAPPAAPLDRIRRSLRLSGPSMRYLFHVLHVGRGRSVLRAPGGPVDLDRHPDGGGPRFDEFERSVLAGVREQPRTLADDHGKDE
jgi:hypothetical protein